MSRRLLIALFLSTLCAGTAASAQTLPERFYAEYALRTSGMTVARSELSLTPAADGRFVYELRVALAGIVSLFRDDKTVERSEWRYRAGDRLQPLDYRYRRTGAEPNDVSIAFDWEERVAHNTIRGESATVPLSVGTLDKLSYLLALMRDLEQGKREVRYRIVEGGAITTYRLRAVGRERLDTALGALDTIKVQRVGEDGEVDLTLWCALGYRFLPVKLLHRQEDGRLLSVFIESVDGLDAPEPSHRADAASARFRGAQ